MSKKQLKKVEFPPLLPPSTWKVEIREYTGAKWTLSKDGFTTYEAASEAVPGKYRDSNNYRIQEVHPTGPAPVLPPPQHQKKR